MLDEVIENYEYPIQNAFVECASNLDVTLDLFEYMNTLIDKVEKLIKS